MQFRVGAMAAVVALVVLTVLRAPTAAHADPPPSSESAYDLAATGATVTGVLGSTHRISVKVQNLGPDSTTPSDVELSPKRLLEVQLPTGTQLAGESTTICDAAIVEPVDPRRFNCLVPPLEPFDITQIDFEVRITGPVTDTGTVTTRAFGPGNDLDVNRANDTASITITVVAGYDISGDRCDSQRQGGVGGAHHRRGEKPWPGSRTS